MPPTGQITSSRSTDSHWLVALTGEHDLATAAALRAELDRVLAGGSGVVVDLSQVTFIDSSVVGVLLNAHRSTAERPGQALVVVAPAGGTPRRLLDFIGVQAVIPLVDTHQDALVTAEAFAADAEPAS